MKPRLDQLLVSRGLAESREQARRLILAGKVLVGGEIKDKAGKSVDPESEIEIRGPKSPYVGRGGEKLAGVFDEWEFEVPGGCLGLDIGASTGGFTDCLLQRGAGRVIAVDVGRAQLHERLRTDARVVSMEKTNARNLTLEQIGGQRADIIVIDVSFISLRLILPPCKALLAPGGVAIALIKPQFEAPRRKVGSGGIVRDREVHHEVLRRIAGFCRDEGWEIQALAPSALRGADGNLEFFIRLALEPLAGQPRPALSLGQIEIEATLDRAYNESAS